jgi:hypothetical protein
MTMFLVGDISVPLILLIWCSRQLYRKPLIAVPMYSSAIWLVVGGLRNCYHWCVFFYGAKVKGVSGWFFSRLQKRFLLAFSALDPTDSNAFAKKTSSGFLIKVQAYRIFFILHYVAGAEGITHSHIPAASSGDPFFLLQFTVFSAYPLARKRRILNRTWRQSDCGIHLNRRLFK